MGTETQTEWYEWRERMAATMETGTLRNACLFEQLALRSREEKRCAECGDPGHIVQLPSRFNHVQYFLCDECDSYFAGSVGGERYSILVPDGRYVVNVASLSNKRRAEQIARKHGGAVRRNIAA